MSKPLTPTQWSELGEWDGKAVTRLVWTHFNYTADEIAVWRQFITNNCSYGLFQEEVCPTTNKEHLQGFIHLTKKHTLKMLQKAVGTGPNFRVALAKDDKQVYCNKEETRKPGGVVFCFGEPQMGPGERSQHRWANNFLLASQGKMEELIALEPAWIMSGGYKHVRNIQQMFAKVERNIHDKNCTWFYGESGAGKTYALNGMLVSKYGDDVEKKVYFHSMVESALWFDNAAGKEVCVIEDLGEAHATVQWVSMLQQLADHVPATLSTKGSAAFRWNFKAIHITSNYSIEEWLDLVTSKQGKLNQHVVDSIKRRFAATHYKTLGKPGKDVIAPRATITNFVPPPEYPAPLKRDTSFVPLPTASQPKVVDLSADTSDESESSETEEEESSEDIDPDDEFPDIYETPEPKRKRPRTPLPVKKRR